ncbi:MAG TPA: DUF58 domain-containing protein [Tepidisphaeraceae bacterium]|jgi:uncharacterized protein (DUF58 family)|nr:DUF58 domain-containing protein [Tepidisphaeraceae bacterium]
MKIVGSRFLDPQILAKLPNLELAARKLVEGLFVGYHKSPDFGYSVEFVDHREYVQGDDLRTVDWRVWARKNKYFVKRFEMETQLKGTVLLDISRSMDFGENRMTKLSYGSYLAASIAYLLIHQNDMAGLVTFDDKIHDYLPARGGRLHLRTILHALSAVQPGPATDVPSICLRLADRIKSRGMVIVISDLLDDPARILRALQAFQHKKHDVAVFHVMDDAEIDLPYQELANFRDMESGRRLAVDPGAFRGKYTRRVGDFLREMREGCQRSNVDYHLVRTSTPLEAAIGKFMAFRAGRSR